MKPFVVRTVQKGVPPETPISNIGNAEEINQYSIRPDKQFYRSKTLTDSAGGGGILTITSNKDLMITKVFIRKASLGSGARSCRFFVFANETGSQIGEMILFFDPGATSTIFMDVEDLDFIPPFYVNMNGGRNTLQLDCSGLGVGEFLYCHVFGFFLD